MRTAKKKCEDLAVRGRSKEQIRAIAVGRDDKELIEFLKNGEKVDEIITNADIFL